MSVRMLAKTAVTPTFTTDPLDISVVVPLYNEEKVFLCFMKS